MSNDQETKVKITGDASGAKEAMRQASEAVRESVSQIKGRFDDMQSVIGKVKGTFVALSVVLAGGKIFKDAVDSTVEWTKESAALGRQLGETASRASVLKLALGDVYVSESAVTAASSKIAMQLRTNEEAFKALGVSTRGSNGELRSSFDIMMDVNKHLLTFREGINRNIEGQKIYGKAWSEVADTLKLTDEAIDAAAKKADELNLLVGEESKASTSRYRAAMNDVGDVLQGMKKTIGDAVLPALSELGEWFASAGPTAIAVLKEAIIGIKDVFADLRLVVMEVWNVVKTVITSVVVVIASVGDAMSKALRFDFSGAKASLQAGMGLLGETITGGVDKAVSEWDRYKKAIADNEAGRTRKETPIKAAEGGAGATPSTDSKGDKDRANRRFQEMKNALAKEKEALGEFRENDLAADLDYWQARLATVQKNTEEEKLIRANVEKEILQVKKAMRQEARTLDDEEISAKKAIAEQELDDKRAALQANIDLGRVSMRQEVQEKLRIEQQKYQIERDALEQRLKLFEADKLKRAQIENQIVLLDKQNAAAKNRIQQQAALEQKRYWEGIMSPIAHTMAQSIQGMVQGTVKLKNVLANIGNAIYSQFTEMMAQQVTKFLAAEAIKTAAAVFGAETRADAEETGAKRGLIATIAAALKTIAINAVKVISGVWAAISSIPVVGPFLAPVMALAAGAAVYGLASRVMSARGGYDIPPGVNPMTQLHENEMVLPAKHADVIRDMADGGKKSRRGGPVNFTVNALDSRSVDQLFRRYGRTFATILSREARHGSPALT